VVAFTDHIAVNLHLVMDVPILRVGRGYWKVDGTLLEDSTKTEQLMTSGRQLRQPKRRFPNAPMWTDTATSTHAFYATIPSGKPQGKSGNGKLLFFLYL
jgi:hypothetical protein